MNFLKLLLAAIFVLGLTIMFPFTSVAGLEYVKAHGKLLLFVIGAINVFIGGGISGGFFQKSLIDGFRYWFQPFTVKGSINPTHGFGIIVLVINVLEILFWVEP